MHSVLPDDSLDGLWEWLPDDDTLIVNARWREIHALPSDADERLRGACWLARVHPEDRGALEEGLRALLEGRIDLHEIDVRLRREDDTWVWVMHRGRTSRIGSGEPFMVCGTLQDITERKRQEALLRESEDFLGRVEHIAGVGGWQLDLLTQCVTWSDETRRIHAVAAGYEPSFLEALDFYPPGARQVVGACMDKAIASGESFDVELPMIRADGNRITVRCIGSVEYRDGRPVRLSGAIQDVTDHVLRHLDALRESHRELERVNERLSLATESGGIGIWDFDVVRGEFVWDEHMFPIYGLSPDDGIEMSGERWLSFVHPDERERVLGITREAITSPDGPRELAFRIVTAQGCERDLVGTARVVRDETGRVIRLVGTNRDITESNRMTREIERQHEILQVTLRSIGDGVITADPSGNVVWMNPVAEAMAGWSAARARGRPLAEVFHIVDEKSGERVPDPVRTCLDEDRITGLASDAILVSRDGTRRWIEDSVAPIRGDDGEVFGAVLVFRDVTEQRSIANEMAWRANHDELTGLVNRAHFEKTLKRLHGRAPETGERHALMLIDLDRFKIVNDTCGHAAGDQLLRQVSRMLSRTVRSRDMVARLGGDEFAIVLEHCEIERAARIAQEICDLMDEYRFQHDGERFRIGTSIGLVMIDAVWPDTEAIVRAADVSCFAAKESGRNRVHVWRETDSAVHERRSQTRWATRLESALEDDGFELYAQRIGALDRLFDEASNDPDGSGENTHAEILLRLRDGDASPVLPGAFLPVAERFNLIDRIDRWVIGNVLSWLHRHRGHRDVGTLWVNISGQSLGDSRFQHDTLQRLSEAGRELCGALCLEISETAAVTNLAEAASFIGKLRALGVRVALDGFGAGASSFGYLRSLPVDYLKIDGQFVRDLTVDPLDAAAVRCFAEVAQVMNARTVAEFVETPEVLSQLRQIGVDFVQGWLLHEPAPIDELLDGKLPDGERAISLAC